MKFWLEPVKASCEFVMKLCSAFIVDGRVGSKSKSL